MEKVMKIKNYVLLAVALIATAVPQASQCSFDWKKIGIGTVATVGVLGAAYLFYKYVLAKPEQPELNATYVYLKLTIEGKFFEGKRLLGATINSCDAINDI